MPALAQKFGYGKVEDYKEGAQKRFSLLENGLLEKPSCRLLLINVRISSMLLSPMIIGHVRLTWGFA